MTEERLPRRRRIRSQRDFDRVFHGQVFAADDVLVMNAARNDVGYTRIGLSMSRKVGNAVLRNRWKRLMREAFRRRKDSLPAGLDLVIRPRRGAQPDFVAIGRSIASLAKRVDRRLSRD